ncbi:MAG TPA: ParB/RepB/Spo0J family partition protein [Rhizobium sp.]|nr:ParB/RepB/Spo0J family partition protein [Rhizobium sp.]
MEQLLLTADRIVLDRSNARKMRDKDSLSSLKASILEHGIIQAITVRPPEAADRDLEGDRYRVFAGARRHQAVTELIAEGKLPTDFLIPALLKNVGDTAADEMSLAENILRRAMRPVDEFKAFSRMADAGASAEEIALRFGQTVRFVQGRMALGRLHPEILDAFDRDEINFEAATAYTIEPDPERQLEVFNSLKGSWNRNNAYHIKEALTGKGVKANSKVAAFIGETNYLTAGGKVTHDLFEDHSYWTSADVIERLKGERVAAIKNELLADGWSFVTTVEELECNYWEMRRHVPDVSGMSDDDAKRLDEISVAIESFSGMDEDELTEEEREEYERLNEEYEDLSDKQTGTYSAELKAKLGVLIRTDNSYAIEYGMSYPGAKFGNLDDNGKKATDPLKLSAPVLSELGKAATAALAEAVEAKPDLALAFLATSIEIGNDATLGKGRPSRLHVERVGYGGSTGEARTFSAAFEHYAGMEADELKLALAKLAAETVDLTEEWFQHRWLEDAKRYDARRAALDAFGASVIGHFDPDSFFASSKKPIIAAAYKEITGEELKDGKKADMAALAADAARKTGWLPEGLRTAGYGLKKPAKSKKK